MSPAEAEAAMLESLGRVPDDAAYFQWVRGRGNTADLMLVEPLAGGRWRFTIRTLVRE